MHTSQLVNVLGATALAVTELVDASVTRPAHTSSSGAAALAVLLQAGPLGVTELGKRVGLTQPAAARMVDALEGSGYVERTRQGRTVHTALTRTGRRSARALLRDRSRELGGLVDGLNAEEQEALTRLLGTVVTNVYARVHDANRICRLCDRAECVSELPRCPVGLAAGEKPSA